MVRCDTWMSRSGASVLTPKLKRASLASALEPARLPHRIR